jgi:hypothetical protein
MTIRAVITRFGLYFFGAIIAVSIVTTILGVQFGSKDIALTITLLYYVVSKFIIENNRELTKKEYWQIFFGAFAINITCAITGIILMLFVVKADTTFIMLALGFGIFSALLSIPIGLWLGQKAGRKAIRA